MMLDFLAASWTDLFEILILWYFFYLLLMFIQDTRAVQVLKGLLILALVFGGAMALHLQVIIWILTKVFAISVLAFLIIFQPELRRGLARIGQLGIFYKEDKTLGEIAKAALMLSKKNVGAIIAIEREVGLKPYIESGIALDSQVTAELLATIFTPNTPLHDGGVIIQGSRVVAAGCLFPLTQNPHFPKTMGTRHRAGVGLSEETDAIVVIVSEETGTISTAIGGKMTKHQSDDELGRALENIYRPQKNKKSAFDFWLKNNNAHHKNAKGHA